MFASNNEDPGQRTRSPLPPLPRLKILAKDKDFFKFQSPLFRPFLSIGLFPSFRSRGGGGRGKLSRSVRKHAYYLSPAIPPTRPHRLSPAPRAGVNFSRGVNRARNIGHSRVRACLLLPPPLPYPDSRPRAPENKHGIEPFLQIQIAGREGRGRGERLGAPRTPSPSSFVPRETFSKKKNQTDQG